MGEPLREILLLSWKQTAMFGEGHVAGDGTQTLGVESGPQLAGSKRRGSQSFNHKEMNSANNLQVQGPQASEEVMVPTDTLIAALGDPRQRTQPCRRPDS